MNLDFAWDMYCKENNVDKRIKDIVQKDVLAYENIEVERLVEKKKKLRNAYSYIFDTRAVKDYGKDMIRKIYRISDEFYTYLNNKYNTNCCN
jgi:hypothetical protein